MPKIFQRVGDYHKKVRNHGCNEENDHEIDFCEVHCD